MKKENKKDVRLLHGGIVDVQGPPCVTGKTRQEVEE